MRVWMIVMIWIAGAVPCMAGGLFLSAGQSLEFSFSSLSLAGSNSDPDILYDTFISWDPKSFIEGSDVEVTLFETSNLELPFRIGEFQGFSTSVEWLLFSEGFLGVAGTHTPAWQDQEGGIRLSVVSGSIMLESLGISTVIDGNIYRRTFSVPEPSFFMFFGIGAGFWVWHERRRYLAARFNKYPV